jgi:hypothetical protein
MPRIIGLLTPVLLVVLGYWSVSNVDPRKSGPLGIIQAMPPLYFLFVALLGVSFVWNMRRKTLDTPVLVLHIIGLIVLLHGAISFIEGNPRFPVVYTHEGLTEYIQRTGETLPSLDARMNWPGFFTVTALLDKVAGTSSVYPFLLWAPLVFNLFYAPLLFSITKTASTDNRVPWIALYLYYSLSWVGQDYFSPQALNFLFFLTFMAIVLRCFRTDRAALPRPIRRIGNGVSVVVRRVLRVPSFQPGGAPILATTTAQRSLMVVALACVYAAIVMSHQLTPVFLLLYVSALVVLRKTVLRGFPLLMAVLFFSFISYGAIGFWSGHIEDIFGGFGKLGGTVKDNVGSKVQVNTSHVYVIYARLLLAGAVWSVAMFGLLRRLRAGRVDLPVLIGFIVPFFVLGGQSYGGEAILRVFLFSLPFAAILVTFGLLPTEKIKLNLTRSVFMGLVAAFLVPTFWLTRYGNEQFEYISKDDYRGAVELSQRAPNGSNLVVLDGNVGNQVAKMEQYNYITLRLPNGQVPSYSPDEIILAAQESRADQSFLFLNHSQVANIELTYGKPKTFFEDETKLLLDSGKFHLLYNNPDARIFSIDTSAVVPTNTLPTQATS